MLVLRLTALRWAFEVGPFLFEVEYCCSMLDFRWSMTEFIMLPLVEPGPPEAPPFMTVNVLT